MKSAAKIIIIIFVYSRHVNVAHFPRSQMPVNDSLLVMSGLRHHDRQIWYECEREKKRAFFVTDERSAISRMARQLGGQPNNIISSATNTFQRRACPHVKTHLCITHLKGKII